MGPIRLTVSRPVLQSETTSTTSGTSEKTVGLKTAKTVEFWANISANTGTVVFNAQTSDDSSTYETQESLTGITGTGKQSIVLNRMDDAMGVSGQVTWTVTGGSATFEIYAVVVE